MRASEMVWALARQGHVSVLERFGGGDIPTPRPEERFVCSFRVSLNVGPTITELAATPAEAVERVYAKRLRELELYANAARDELHAFENPITTPNPKEPM